MSAFLRFCGRSQRPPTQAVRGTHVELELLVDNGLDEAGLVAEALVDEVEPARGVSPAAVVVAHALLNEMVLALLVVLVPDVEEVVEDLLGRGVLLDLALDVEADHVRGRDRAAELEGLLDAQGRDGLLALGREVDREEDGWAVISVRSISGADAQVSVWPCR